MSFKIGHFVVLLILFSTLRLVSCDGVEWIPPETPDDPPSAEISPDIPPEAPKESSDLSEEVKNLVKDISEELRERFEPLSKIKLKNEREHNELRDLFESFFGILKMTFEGLSEKIENFIFRHDSPVLPRFKYSAYYPPPSMPPRFNPYEPRRYEDYNPYEPRRYEDYNPYEPRRHEDFNPYE